MIQIQIGLLTLCILLSSLRQLHFYQLKEYRIDRLIDFIRFDKGKRQLFKIPFVLTYLAAITLLFLNQNEYYILLILILNLISQIIYGLTTGFHRPKPTKKALLILALHYLLLVLLLILLLHFLSISSYTSILITYLISPLLLLSLLLIFIPITKFAKESVIKKAKQKIESNPNLKIIGITGSYGKSSTKEFLYQILSSKFKVLKTPANINTDIGVAGIILRELKDDHEIFIVEMGAYRIGEIANICKMTPPDISILTAISHQHVSLFGSFDNIKKAKSEILTNQKPGAISIINLDSQGVIDAVKNLKLNEVSYGSQNKNAKNLITDAKQNKEHIEFKLNNEDFKANVLGTHQSQNITAAILAARHLKMTDSEIKKVLEEIESPIDSLKVIDGYNGSIIIDDSYNSNPDGFIAAIDAAKNKKVEGKKILITMGMIELGKKSEEHHKRVGQLANKYFDLIIVTKKEPFRFFEKVIESKKLHLLENPEKLTQFLKENVLQYDLILIENRLTPLAYNLLTK